MLIKIGRFEFTECWDGVLYKSLSNYPYITEWEIQSILDFTGYEKSHGRSCHIEAEDHFHYIMFAWGNCQAGDRLVTERKLGRAPTEAELMNGFTPGVRFYFRYDDIIRHPNAVFDGVLPIKVKDEVLLEDYVYAIVIPSAYKDIANAHIPESLKSRTHFLDTGNKDIWQWAEAAYEYIKAH